MSLYEAIEARLLGAIPRIDGLTTLHFAKLPVRIEDGIEVAMVPQGGVPDEEADVGMGAGDAGGGYNAFRTDVLFEARGKADKEGESTTRLAAFKLLEDVRDELIRIQGEQAPSHGEILYAVELADNVGFDRQDPGIRDLVRLTLTVRHRPA